MDYSSKLVIVTGGFDPITPAHIKYFEAANKLGEDLFVYLNSDDWLTRKKGKPFMPANDRQAILNSIHWVDQTFKIPNNGDADDTACWAIEKALKKRPDAKIIFANGGDRLEKNTPEQDRFAGNDRVEFVFNVGGSKTHSSSTYLKEWNERLTNRRWGCYNVLTSADRDYKTKELFIEPGKSISLQRHEHRTEHWVVVKGQALVRHHSEHDSVEKEYHMIEDSVRTIRPGDIHKITNCGNETLIIIEVQTGDYLEEDDIERFEPVGKDEM